MAIIRNISEPIEEAWYESPFMQKLMARDQARADKAIAAYYAKLKANKKKKPYQIKTKQS